MEKVGWAEENGGQILTFTSICRKINAFCFFFEIRVSTMEASVFLYWSRTFLFFLSQLFFSVVLQRLPTAVDVSIEIEVISILINFRRLEYEMFGGYRFSFMPGVRLCRCWNRYGFNGCWLSDESQISFSGSVNVWVLTWRISRYAKCHFSHLFLFFTNAQNFQTSK